MRLMGWSAICRQDKAKVELRDRGRSAWPTPFRLYMAAARSPNRTCK